VRVLVACEFSGVVRRAFRALGHDAWSREARVHKMPPSPDRWKNRSRTFPGIARAMASQWAPLLP